MAFEWEDLIDEVDDIKVGPINSIAHAVQNLEVAVNDNAKLFYEVYSCNKDNRSDPDRILRCTIASHDSSIVISGDRFFRR